MPDNLTVELENVNNSLAFNLLDDLEKEGKINKAQADLYKVKFSKLYELVVETQENEKNFLKRVKELNQQLLAEKIRLEKTAIEQAENAAVISQLKEQLKKKEAEQEQLGEKDVVLAMQQAECQQRVEELNKALEDREAQHKAEVQPEIERLEGEIEINKQDIANQEQQRQHYQQRVQELEKRIRQETRALEGNQETSETQQKELQKTALNPERLKKQNAQFENAARTTERQLSLVRGELEDLERKLEEVMNTKEELKKAYGDKGVHLNFARQEVERKEAALAEYSKKLEEENLNTLKQRDDRVAHEVLKRQTLSEIRQLHLKLSAARKAYDQSLRSFKRTEDGRIKLKIDMPDAIKDRTDALKNKTASEEELARHKQLLREVQAEVELFIGAFLKQEAVEKGKKSELSLLQTNIGEMQHTLGALRQQESVRQQHLRFVAAQREQISRECAVASRHHTDALAELQMRQLERTDLKKHLQETKLRSREYTEMYEIVKNERNKYVTQIQSSEQQLAEMKEKHKILQNEVEILKLESAGKDRMLAKVRMDTQKQRDERDRLRAEFTRIDAKAQRLNERVEQFVIEIDKLNSVINGLEREMGRLRRDYETAVEMRNFTGIQLIDRNDELCILWEKLNMQERMATKGTDSLVKKEEMIRVLELDVKEEERKLTTQQKRVPEVPRLTAEVYKLREDLQSEKKKAEDLSHKIEEPNKQMRKWRELPGSDPDLETLRTKLELLEERLAEKKELLLEKDLILEEICAFSEKLRMQAAEGRDSTLDLASQLNAFQQRVKELTRRMMATVSELSMYQASALKLKHDRDELARRVDEARENMAEGRPVTPNAEREFWRSFEIEQQRASDLQMAKLREKETALLASNATRTTAEPRVTAYIPEGELVPKAYGHKAPFMPSVPGAAMRHFRNPNPKPIEI